MLLGLKMHRIVASDMGPVCAAAEPQKNTMLQAIQCASSIHPMFIWCPIYVMLKKNSTHHDSLTLKFLETGQNLLKHHSLTISLNSEVTSSWIGLHSNPKNVDSHKAGFQAEPLTHS